MQYIANEECPEKKESLKKTRRFESDLNKRRLPSKREAAAESLRTLPGLVHQKALPRAGEVLHVASGLAVDDLPDRFANSQEVGPQTADGVFGDVRQGLVGGRPEQEAAHGLVDARQVLGPRPLVGVARHVDRQAFSTDDLHHRIIQPLGPAFTIFGRFLPRQRLRTTTRVKGIITPPSSW